MCSPKSLLAGGACALLLTLTRIGAPQTLSISGLVETMDHKPLPHAEVRAINAGGTVTSDSGEFSIPLPPQFEPGTPVLLRVAGWVVIDPYDGGSGQTYVRQSTTDVVRIVVARKGDPRLLSNRQLVQQIVQGVASQLEPRPNSAASSDVFLADQANELGFTLDQLKSAINDWSKNVQEPYQKGLAALYASRFAEASEYIRESLNGPENDLVSKYVLLSLAEIAQAHYAVAEAVLLKAHAIRNEDATVLNNLGLVFTDEAKYAEAERCLKTALAIDEKALGPEDRNVAPSLNNLAVLYEAQARYAEAEPLFKRALTINERALGPEDPIVAKNLGNLAMLYLDEGRYAEGEGLCKHALAIDEKAPGAEHLSTARDLNNLAALDWTQGDYTEAAGLYFRALLINETTLGPDHPDVAAVISNLGQLFRTQGKYRFAESAYKRALAIDEKALGAEHPNVATDLNNLAVLQEAQGRYAEAEPLFKRALAINEKALGAEHPSVAANLNGLALLYYRQGKYAEAEPLYRRALAIVEKVFGPEHFLVGTLAERLADTLHKLGRDAEAKTYEGQAAKILEQAKPQPGATGNAGTPQ